MRSDRLKTFDPFENQKRESFHASKKAMLTLAANFDQYIKRAQDKKDDPASLRGDFERILKVGTILFFTGELLINPSKHSLWGNKTDLSILATRSNDSQDLSRLQVSSHDALLALDDHILVDDTDSTFDVLLRSSRRRVDVVLDNSGFELFNDLCLADWLLESGLARNVHLHLKTIPWFVSDALRRDFDWLLDQLDAADASLSALGRRWRSCVETNRWVVTEHAFWTLPHEFVHMNDIAPDLHADLAKADLIFFKGDLNYRKLLADRHWAHCTSFTESLCGFRPAPLCALRSLKAELVTGLASGRADELFGEARDWLVSGQYAVIQLAV